MKKTDTKLMTAAVLQINSLRHEVAKLEAKQTRLHNSYTDILPNDFGFGSASSPYANTLSGMDTMSMSLRYFPVTINRILLANMYSEHGLMQTANDLPVEDAFRGGLEITSKELSGDDIKAFQDYLDENDILATFQQGKKWERLFGGAGLLINVNVDPRMPYMAKATEDGRLSLYAVDRWELQNPRGSETYNFYGKVIHRTRVVEFVGKPAPSMIRPMYQGWGMSVAERMVRELNAFIKNNNLVFELLDEAKIDVFRFKNMADVLSQSGGRALIDRRIQEANRNKNFKNALIMDSEDEYQQKQLTFSGLADIYKELRIGIASALRMPMTKLFGLSASGFNSGEDDIENYNSMVETEIRTPSRKALKTVLDLCMYQCFGYVPSYKFAFKPLREMSAKEQEELATSRQNRIMQWYDKQMMSTQEAGEMAKHYDLLPIETDMERGLLPPHVDTTPPALAGGTGPGRDVVEEPE